MRMRTILLASALLLGSLQAWAADVTGTWSMTVETQAGTGNPTFHLKQQGQNITGDYKGQLGEAPVTGTLKGNDLELSYKISAQGQDLVVKYTGTVSGDSVSGKVSLGELGEGTFKGMKQK